MMQQGIMSKLDALRQNMGQGQSQPAPAGPAPMAPPIQDEPQPQPMLMQDQAPEMVAEAEQPAPVDAGEDAQKLASAVLQRSQGNPQLALDIIEGAKGVVMQTIQGSERPRMMKDGGATNNLPNEGLKALAESGEKGKKAVEAMGFMAGGGDVSEALERLNYLRGLS